MTQKSSVQSTADLRTKRSKEKNLTVLKRLKFSEYKDQKKLHLQEQGRVYPFSEAVWLHRVPALIFLYENAGQNVFVCYPVNGMRLMKGLLLHWKIFGLLPINQKNGLKTIHVNCSYLNKNWANYLLAG